MTNRGLGTAIGLLLLLLGCGISFAQAEVGNRVYLAGPLFTEGERFEMESIAQVLEADGFHTFLPHRDGLEFNSIFPYLVNTLKLDPDIVARQMHYAIDALDIYQVAVGSDAIVMNINGRTPDEGAVAELAIAWALGKPGIIFNSDSRSLSSGRNNPLVTGRSDFVQATKLQEVPILLRAQIEAYSIYSSGAQRNMPFKLAQKVAQGEKIWNVLQEFRNKETHSGQRNSRIARLIQVLFPPCELLLR